MVELGSPPLQGIVEDASVLNFRLDPCASVFQHPTGLYPFPPKVAVVSAQPITCCLAASSHVAWSPIDAYPLSAHENLPDTVMYMVGSEELDPEPDGPDPVEDDAASEGVGDEAADPEPDPADSDGDGVALLASPCDDADVEGVGDVLKRRR
jgi:hypothetical protein